MLLTNDQVAAGQGVSRGAMAYRALLADNTYEDLCSAYGVQEGIYYPELVRLAVWHGDFNPDTDQIN